MAQKKRKKPVYQYKPYQRKRRGCLHFIIGSFIVVMVIFFGTLIYLSESVSSPISTNEKKEAFIIRLSGYAQTLQEEYDVLPSISIAQAILESNWGTSDLSVENNNYYGIKGSDPKNTVNMRTKEYVDGEWIEIEAPFRKYDDWRESMKDHALLFVNGTNWNPDQYQTVLEAEDYKEAAVALSKSGYATDPTYSDKLIHLIEQYRLYQYD